MDGDDVRDEHLAKACGERGREVANLVGVRKEDECGVRVPDQLLERGHEAVRGVGLEQTVLDAVDPVELLGRELRRGCSHALAASLAASLAGSEHGGGAGHAERGGQLLPRGQGFEAHPVPAPSALFEDYENSCSVHITLTSNLSFSTNCAAISAGVPEIIWVFFCFSGG